LGLCLIAMSIDWSLLLVIFEVAVGLGMVIFVHELGHFAVAKMCGVKCEKFYLGFDIAGLKLCKFTWGETEYGIGILPLGGYVKMLGQEDNPAKLREEIERAKRKQSGEESADAAGKDAVNAAEGAKPGSDPQEPAKSRASDVEPIDVKAAEEALYDPRSYLAQSVPKRMAIISAGVIMNLVFAFAAAIVAFQIGVPRRPCRVGGVLPGQGAWQQNIEVGYEIQQVEGRKIEKFRDMQEAVTLGDKIQEGLPIWALPPGEEEPRKFLVKPDSSGLIPMIGIHSSATTTLSDREPAFLPGSPAAAAEPGFQLGDVIVKLDAEPIDHYYQLHRYLARHPEKELTVTVRRAAPSAEGDGDAVAPEELLPIRVGPNRMRRLGLVMEMGEISALQANSPLKGKIEPGDRIDRIDFDPPEDPQSAGNPQSPGDPMTLPDRLRKLAAEAGEAGKKIRLFVKRGDEDLPPIDVTLRDVDTYSEPLNDNSPLAVPALGIAYYVGNTVQKVIPESVLPGNPAAKAGLRAGDELVEATVIPPEEQTPLEEKLGQSEAGVEFGDEHQNWPSLIYSLQELLPKTRVQLTWKREGEELTATLDPVADPNWFNPKRGFLLKQDEFIQQGENLLDSIRLAAHETTRATLLVYRFLQKLGTGQVSPRALGGPVTIFVVAKRFADKGFAELLIFLTLISANLAVINFLPIPLLDGGHMVFLAWEGIRGKPADERVQLALTYVGLVFILGLMAWVLGLDFGLIPR